MVTTPPIATNTINWGLIGGISGIVIIIVLLMIFFMYRKRSTPILKMFGSSYFRFEILSPARKTQIVNKMTKDFKIIGNIILFDAPGGRYKVMDDRIFLRDKIPTSMYKFGNPLPINVYDNPEPEIVIWDEDNKTFMRNKMSAQELKEATDSKVVSDLNKFTYSKMEVIMIIIGVIAIIFNVVVLYEVIQVNSEFGTLINELNQILANLPKTTSSAPVAFFKVLLGAR